MKGDIEKFKARLLFPFPKAQSFAMAIEELSFAAEIDWTHRAELDYQISAMNTLPVAIRREAHQWALTNLDPKPVARHKLATQKARLDQIRDRR